MIGMGVRGVGAVGVENVTSTHTRDTLNISKDPTKPTS